ncbi:MAG: enoyl-CoA hydratase-related protein, partial [Elusimicrobiota bacterium]
MSQEGKEVLVSTQGPVGMLTLNRPKALNALNRPLMEQLVRGLEAFEADPAIRCVVVAGSQKAFAAGADIRELSSLKDGAEARSSLAAHLARWDRVAHCSKPTVAAVSGYALGGGLELALACDMIVASETAVFGQPEILIGVIPGAGGTQRLTRAVGKAMAMEMMLTARKLGAREALDLGLVNRVVPTESF